MADPARERRRGDGRQSAALADFERIQKKIVKAAEYASVYFDGEYNVVGARDARRRIVEIREELRAAASNVAAVEALLTEHAAR